MLQDLRYALRTLARSPGFTTVAALTLALGIGSNTAVFSVVNSVLLRPLPYGAADRLYLLWEKNQRGEYRLASYPTFLDWRAEGGVADLAFIRGRSGSLHGRDGAARVIGAFVSDGFLKVIEARPSLGRTFSSDEQRSAGSHVAVLTDDLWRREFGGDRAVVGTEITVDDASYTVVGVLPPGVRYPDWADFYAPLAAIAAQDSGLAQRGLHADSRVLARLKHEATPDQARTALAGISARLAAAYPKENEGWTAVDMLPLREEVLGFGAVRPILLLLTATVALVLLIACANVANMSLVRAATRSRELAIRAALGAGRGRVIRQLVAEAAVLGLAGGLLGLLFALWGIGLLKAAAPGGLPRVEEIAIEGRVLGFTILSSLLTVVIIGVVPALHPTGSNLTESLKAGTLSGGSGPARSRLRGSLVALEVALALSLLVGAGLLVRSFWRLSHVDPGFNPTRLVTLDVFPPANRYDAPERAVALYRRLAETVSAVPGVQAVALSNHVPLSGAWLQSRIEVPGKTPDRAREQPVLFRTISAEYFRTMEIPLRRGRPFTDADIDSRAPVAIVNQTLARRYWPDEDPVGRPVTLFKSAQNRADFGQPFTAQVVGVAGDVRHVGLADPAAAEVYVPYTVNPWGHIVLVARTKADPETLIPALRRAVASVDAGIPVSGATRSGGFTTMEDFFAGALARRRFTVTLLAAFAASALLLAALGIYGVVSYVVAIRTREIGVRAALGAARRDIAALVIAQSLRVVGVGLGAGLVGAAALTRLLRSMLYGVGATDPATFAGVTLLLSAVALFASYLPARRATRVDPMVALRYE